MKSYTDLIKLPTFEERFNYLKLDSSIGEDTFGDYRYLNQQFYSSREWKKFRKFLIVRDGGCDLAIQGRDIPEHIVIHHINPLSIDDILNGSSALMNPENLVCVSEKTHRALHYGYYLKEEDPLVERSAGDTKLW